MIRWREVLSKVETRLLHTMRFTRRVVLWPTLFAIAWAAALWPLCHRDRLPIWSENSLRRAEQSEQLGYLAVAVLVMALVTALFFWIGRVTSGSWQVERRASRFNRLFAFSLGAPFVVALARHAPAARAQDPDWGLHRAERMEAEARSLADQREQWERAAWLFEQAATLRPAGDLGLVLEAIAIRICVLRVGSEPELLAVGETILVRVPAGVIRVARVEAVRGLPRVGQTIVVGIR